MRSAQSFYLPYFRRRQPELPEGVLVVCLGTESVESVTLCKCQLVRLFGLIDYFHTAAFVDLARWLW